MPGHVDTLVIDASAEVILPTPTPCIGICSTTFGDVVCRGCRRYLHEIVNWNQYDDIVKRLVWQRLEMLARQVLSGCFDIPEPTRLLTSLRAARLDARLDDTPWLHLLALLRAIAGQEPDLETFGVRRTDRTGRSLVELREYINAELTALANAYYEKDHLRASRAPVALSDAAGK